MKYPIGIQSFERLRKGDYVYIDKTALIYELVNSYNTVFLGRPRRFGKSLLMSTLHEYFAGHRELFEGLAIETLETEWKTHPVLHFDLNTGDYGNYGISEIENVLNYQLEQYECIYGGRKDTLSNRFLNLIKSAYEQTGETVVVLIDEYDKPVLATMGKGECEQEAVRNVLKSFYGCLKTYGKYLRFVMLTGVSKFGKLSVFSDLNNIEDISLSENFADICGLTKNEILSTFEDEIDAFARMLEVPHGQMIDMLRRKYDGYRFSSAEKLVFNPYSLLNSIKNKKLKDYWFESGTPTFLVKLLKKYDYDLSDIEGREIDEDSLYKVDDISPVPLLYQSGYLTIKDYDHRRYSCILGYPNQEVENGFLDFLIPFYSDMKKDMSLNEIDLLIDEIRSGDVDAFMQHLKSMFASIPYAQDNSAKVQEDQFRNLMYIIFRLLGIHIQVECPMSRGRTDAVIKTSGQIYVMEFKVNASPEVALAQIHTKGYADPYLTDGRPVTLIGINYGTIERGITGWIIEQ